VAGTSQKELCSLLAYINKRVSLYKIAFCNWILRNHCDTKKKGNLLNDIVSLILIVVLSIIQHLFFLKYNHIYIILCLQFLENKYPEYSAQVPVGLLMHIFLKHLYNITPTNMQHAWTHNILLTAIQTRMEMNWNCRVQLIPEKNWCPPKAQHNQVNQVKCALSVTIGITSSRGKTTHTTNSGKRKKYKPNGGVEPPTLRLRVSRSTDWASQALDIISKHGDL
jgi:hypothetical protein